MTRKEKEFRLKELTTLIEQAKTTEACKQREVASSQKVLAAYQKEFADITISLTKVRSGVTVSDHALLRYLERKYKFDFEQYREEILTPINKMAIKAGAISIRVDSIKFCVKNNTIITVI